jgi:hypothetical protein
LRETAQACISVGEANDLFGSKRRILARSDTNKNIIALTSNEVKGICVNQYCQEENLKLKFKPSKLPAACKAIVDRPIDVAWIFHCIQIQRCKKDK